MKKRTLIGLASTWLAPWASSFAQARYPQRSIRLVVPFAPAGDGDILGRVWAKYATPLLGTTQGVPAFWA